MDEIADGGPARFLTPADTAIMLNVTLDEVFGVIASGELPAIRVGRQWRIERPHLDAYIEARYEESRRMALWRQSEFADIPDLFEFQNRTNRS